ncbi:MAG: hypothetical protein AB8B73_11210, partial [Ekhidna sp.]
MMVKKLSLKLLKTSFILLPSILFGQEWKHVSSPEINSTPTAFSVDLQNNFYLGFSDGRITKYDNKGSEKQTFSLSNQVPVSLIEAQNSLKLFAFNFDNQRITFLDRFSAIPKSYFLAEYNTSLGMMACPSPDGNVWVAENNPRRLRKIDLLRQQTILEIQTSLGDSIQFMRTLQNLLILSDENGVHVFDQFGSKEHFVKAGNVNFIQTIDDNILFSSNQDIIIINPYDGQVIEQYTSPVNDTKVVIKLKGRYLFIGKSIELY